MKPVVDYSLYLVTDSRPAILQGRDFSDVVKQAIHGGARIVQLREKSLSTADFIKRAKALRYIAHQNGIPLLINDRVDVALAVQCDGVHIGQDDMDVGTARRLLGPDAIIGVTVSSEEEALRACQDGADYLGIGTVFATSTKTDTKSIIGPEGVSVILAGLVRAGYKIPTVCIGGIDQSNTAEILAKCPQLSGIAVVSAVMASPEPTNAARELRNLVDSLRPPSEPPFCPFYGDLVRTVVSNKPISHNMTNLVVQNIAANVALAVGASPIMSGNAGEAADLAALGGALVINMGTVTPDGLENYVKALRAYNAAGRPVVFDPVGAGASALRRNAVKTILTAGRVDVIKGNEGEIRATFGEDGETQQRGVDSSNTLNMAQKATLVMRLAQREQCVVVMTGREDYVTNGDKVYIVRNGHGYLSEVTGMGCSLGTAISAAVAVGWGGRDVVGAVLGAMLHFEIAAELAAERPEVRGPGTFVPAFLDELAKIRDASARDDFSWEKSAELSAYIVRQSSELD